MRQTYSEQCQTFKMERFTRRILPEYRCATRNFSGQRGGLWNSGPSINISSKTQEKKPQRANILKFFLLDTLKGTA